MEGNVVHGERGIGKPATVLLPLDGTSQALAALPVARRLAAIEHATLQVVHVTPSAVPSVELPGRTGLDREELHGAVLDNVTGAPADGIARAATERGSAWIVMCARTSTPPDHPLGRTAARVLAEAPCPVVLVPPQRGLAPWELRRVLLPFDGSPAMIAAVRPAAELAARAGASLLVLHVATAAGAPPTEQGTLVTPRYVDQPQHEWPEWTREFLERAASLGAIPESLGVRRLLATGDPAEEICRCVAATPIDLVVLAWHGRLEGARAATVKALIREAPCPVLILRV